MKQNTYIVHLIKNEDENGDEAYDSTMEYVHSSNLKECIRFVKQYYYIEGWQIDYIAEVKYQRKEEK